MISPDGAADRLKILELIPILMITIGQKIIFVGYVEVAGVPSVTDDRHVRRHRIFVENRAPAPFGRSEPSMLLDVLESVGQIAVPLGHVSLEQVPQQVHQIARETRRAHVFSLRDAPEQPFQFTVGERHAAGHQLVQKHPERPIVDGLPISCAGIN